MIEFELRGDENDFIALNQLLKASGLCEHGAMANEVISEGMVQVNGEVDLRKRAKLKRGDQIKFNNDEIKIV